MSQPETADRAKPALALSGGGFRAALYHVGTVIRLNELGMLQEIERISSVSGGSITAGLLAARWDQLDFTGGVATNLDSEFVEPIREFCRRSIDVTTVGWGSILPGKSIGDVLADTYDELFRGITLRELPDKPQFVFDATNVQTGRLFRMQKVRMADYSVGEIPNPAIRVAVAVAASSAFPPVLSPVHVATDPEDWLDMPGTSHFQNLAYKRVLTLMDGGAYDNLGLETVDDFATLIVSDAGAPFSMEGEASTLWPQQLMRALDIATDQARGLRKRLLHAETQASGRVYAYAGIDNDPMDYTAPRTLHVNRSVTEKLARLRTRLNEFSEEEQGRLINWGWYMTDIAVRTYVKKGAPAPSAWPYPAWPLS